MGVRDFNESLMLWKPYKLVLIVKSLYGPLVLPSRVKVAITYFKRVGVAPSKDMVFGRILESNK